MKVKIALLCLLIISITFFDSCKKYAEGPMFSFRSAANRLDGHWVIASAQLNNEDALVHHSPGSYISDCGDEVFYDETITTTDYTWDFFDDSLIVNLTTNYLTLNLAASINDCYNIYIEHSNPYIYHHTFQLTEKKTKIVRDDGLEYTIDKLLNKELRLTRVKNDSMIYTYQLLRE